MEPTDFYKVRGMKRENKIDEILNSTQGIEMPVGSEFMYPQIEGRISGSMQSNTSKFRSMVRKRIIIGAGVLAINSLVLLFSLSGSANAAEESTDASYNMEEAVDQFFDLYQDQLNYGINEK
ncbi:MAG: hypothetical protein ACI9J3_001336 [Parvicellaceae bacterium]